MGLDTSHDAWHGGYGSFNIWREKLFEVAGYPPLNQMEGFRGTIPFSSLKHRPLLTLIDHSDCDGDIKWQDCGPLADDLETLVPLLPEGAGPGHISDWKEKTCQFIKGLRTAHALKEDLVFQ